MEQSRLISFMSGLFVLILLATPLFGDDVPSVHFAVTPSSGIAPLHVVFTDLSVLPDPLAFSYTWDFGDGAFSSDPSPVHEYSTPGEYLVTLRLTATNPAYQSSEYTLPERIHVYPSSPQAQFTWAVDQENVPMQVRFTDQSYSSVDITDWNWMFTAGGVQIATSTEKNPEIQFAFDDSNTFPSHITAELTITTANNERFSIAQDVETSAHQIPLAGFAIVHSNPPGTVTFIDQTIIDPIIADTSPLRYQWKWDFGDGSSPIFTTYFTQNPEHTYAGPGTYLVTQTAQLMDEALRECIHENTVSMHVIIPDLNVPKAAFTWVSNQENVPMQVRFIDQSYSHSNIIDWKWTFTADDVQIATSTEQNPEIQFAFDDSKAFPSHVTAELTITTASAEIFTVTHNVEISFRLFPLAGFAIVHSNPPGTVTFIDQTLVDPSIAGSSPLQYQWEWDFGDGSSPILTSYYTQNPEHTYVRPGTYLVTQTARLMDESLENCVRENMVSMHVIIPDFNVPKAAFTWVSDQENVPMKVSFTDQSYSHSTITNWDWTFTADGIQVATSTEQNPEIHFAFDDSKAFPSHIAAELTIATASAENFTVTHNIEVSARLFPLAGFAVVHSNPPGTVTFIDQTLVDPIIADTSPLRYQWEWNFGDGSSPILTSYFTQNPEHSYANPGKYLVTQTVRLMDETLEECIRENTASMSVIIPDISSPKAAFTWVFDHDYVPVKVSFIDQSYSYSNITGWNWTFTADGVQIATSTDQNPEIQFAFDDRRTFPSHVTAELAITTANAENFTVAHNVEISARLFPLAGFTIVHSNPPGTVTFIDQSLVDPIIAGSSPLRYQWEWNFGDGSPPILTSYYTQSPEHTYTKPGTYLVTQTVRLMDETLENCIRENTVSMHVIIPDLNVPKAAFTWVSDHDYVPMAVRFIDQSYAHSNITDWNWTFTADGIQIATSTEQNPEIQFAFDDSRTFPSNITAELTITTANNENFTVTHNVEVSARLFPLAGFAIVHSNPPGTVTFIDQSLVDPVIAGLSPLRYQWEWDFGDGSPPILTSYFTQSPEHAYAGPGKYQVTQTVRLMDETLENCIRENTASMSVIIPELSGPKAAFTWVSDHDYVPMTVRFIDQSYSPMNITNWNWTFTANGVQIATSTDQNPEIQFVFDDSKTFPSNITAELTITTANNENFTVTHNVSISARLFPLAGFAVVHSNPPGMVTFIDQSLVDPIIAGLSPLRYQWEWDFGDGSPPLLTSYYTQSPEHTYAGPGKYLVTQTVRLMDESLQNCIRENTASMYVIISDPLPAIAMFTAAPLSGTAPLTVSFTDLSTGDIATWKWNFGDGSAPMYEQHPVHIYNQPGIYTVTLELFDADGVAIDSHAKSVFIHVEGPLSAQFTAAPRLGLPPLAVSFTDLSVGAAQWKWDFGDDTISYEQHPLHTYTSEGIYKVVLQVWDLYGQSAMATEENFVHASYAPGPIADFTAIPQSGPVPLIVSFIDQTISHGTIDSYVWEFGNGEVSTEKNPTTVYTEAGSYDVTLTVTDRYGTDSCIKLNIIVAEALQAAFIATPPSGLPPLSVSFTDKSTGAPILWKWNFGDGHTSDERNPMNVYTKHGIYTVTLAIFDVHGKTSRSSQTINVLNPEIQANFIWENTNDLTVQFTDISAGEGINFWEWNFNDGSEFSYEQHPLHTFPSCGEYTVILKISNGIYTSTKYRSVTVV